MTKGYRLGNNSISINVDSQYLWTQKSYQSSLAILNICENYSINRNKEDKQKLYFNWTIKKKYCVYIYIYTHTNKIEKSVLLSFYVQMITKVEINYSTYVYLFYLTPWIPSYKNLDLFSGSWNFALKSFFHLGNQFVAWQKSSLSEYLSVWGIFYYIIAHLITSVTVEA